MQEIDQWKKTLVFCATQVHALAVRDLINQIKTGTDTDYCVRVTANDGKIGERHLWSRPDTRQKLLKGLEVKGYGREQLTG